MTTEARIMKLIPLVAAWVVLTLGAKRIARAVAYPVQLISPKSPIELSVFAGPLALVSDGAKYQVNVFHRCSVSSHLTSPLHLGPASSRRRAV